MPWMFLKSSQSSFIVILVNFFYYFNTEYLHLYSLHHGWFLCGYHMLKIILKPKIKIWIDIGTHFDVYLKHILQRRQKVAYYREFNDKNFLFTQHMSIYGHYLNFSVEVFARIPHHWHVSHCLTSVTTHCKFWILAWKKMPFFKSHFGFEINYDHVINHPVFTALKQRHINIYRSLLKTTSYLVN